MASGYNYENFKELQNDIGNAFQSGLNEKDFLPEDQLQYFVVEQVVKSVLQQQCILDEDIVRFVLDRAPRIFLIFVIMGEDKLRSLRDLKELGIDDSVLPIHISKDGNDEKYFSYSLEKETPLRQFPIANRWSRQDRDMFLLYQMQVTAPVFGQEDKFQFKFHPKRILPYLPDSGGSDKSISSGFFGEVKKRILHRSHIDKKVLNVLSELGLISTAGNGPGLAVAVKEAKDNEGLAGYPEKEAHNLHKMLLQDYKSRHLIKPIAAYEMDGRHCLIFPWAEGGNLVNYWKKYAEGPLEKENFQWILNQFVGICLGLLELHESNCRHGDLKPENILWFKEITQRGTLQLADMGLATFHDKDEDTGRRKDIQTMTPSGTSRYEPPEENDNRVKKGPRSRNYDVWSLGCTILELLVWLTSGYEELKSFRARTRKYFWKDTGTTSGRYVLDPDVEACIKAIRFNANACQAHLDLLGMVENRLLVIPVPDALKPAPGQRAGAKEVFNCIKEISSKVQNDSTYLTASALSRSTVLTKPGVVYEKDGNLAVPGHAEESRHLRPSDPTQKTDLTMKVPVQLPGQPTLRTQDTVTFGQTRHHEQYNVDQSSKLNDDWESVPNDELSAHILEVLGWDKVKPTRLDATLGNCANHFTKNASQIFDEECDLAKLAITARACDLCNLLSFAIGRIAITPLPDLLELCQKGGQISIKDGPELLSLYYDPSSKRSEGMRLGLPVLLDPASPTQFDLLKEWIKLCDVTHDMCHRRDNDTLALPTRLIAVDEPMRLVESVNVGLHHYLALSHCWGLLKGSERFCTYRSNIAQLQDSIPYDKLPRTFRDAITITKGLGLQYLWIDSLCIIQDDLDDWETEARNMGDIFSAAYCTLCASSAKSSTEGFLTPREPRPNLQLMLANGVLIYVCLAIDDFHQDVERSVLNSRGWVLQERALSRRSIHYTSRQVYWECSAGVYCETLARLRNSKADFLSDANFPSAALDYYRDGRQILIQDLYERYSNLAFTVAEDRAVALLGLQKRLARAFKSRAAYGIFAVYLARGLLWKCGQLQGMKPIQQPTGRCVPTWSWLSKEGSIRYMELEFEKIDWAIGEFDNPFSHHQPLDVSSSASHFRQQEATILCGLARRLRMTHFEMLVLISFDTKQKFEVGELRCVIIGRDKPGSRSYNCRIHVLVVCQVRADQSLRYERVGVASLRPQQVECEGLWVAIH